MIADLFNITYDPSTSATLTALGAGQTAEDAFAYTVAPDFSRIVTFGDSLSDEGNLYALTGSQFPPFPYWEGRISNGPVWIEYFEPLMGLEAASRNFAVAGATTGRDNTNDALLGVPEPGLPGLLDEVDIYLGAVAGIADADALYVVWAGPNDFFLSSDPVVTIGQAVTNVATAITSLYLAGARNFLVPNMVDLGQTPWAVSEGMSEPLSALSAGFNQGLAQALAATDSSAASAMTGSSAGVEMTSSTGETALTTLSAARAMTNSSTPGDDYWDSRTIARTSASLAPRHRRTAPSSLVEARVRPSGEKATDVTHPRCPVNVVFSSPLLRSHSLIVPSRLAEATVLSSGEIASQLTPP